MTKDPDQYLRSRSTVPPHEPTPRDDERFRGSRRPFIVIPQTPALRLALFLWMLAFGLASVAIAQGHVVEQVASVTGRVALTAADGAKSSAAGVRLILNCEAEPLPRVEISDEQGAFRFERVPADGCTISTDLQGFRSATAAVKARQVAELQFHLEVEPVFASVTVIGAASADARIGCHVSGGAAEFDDRSALPREGAEDDPESGLIAC